MTNLPPNDGGEHRIIIKGGRNGETNTRSYRFDIYRSGGVLNLQLNVNSSGSGSGVGFNRSVTMSTGVWYHIAATFDASTGEGKIYLDGVQQGATATGLGSSIADTSGLLSVGGINWGGSESFDGDMDEVRIWAAVRSQAEIDANKAVELVGNETNLNAYYKFNNSAVDSTANGNTLTAINGVGYTTDVPFTGSTAYTKDIGEVITLVEVKQLETGKNLPQSITLVETVIRDTAKAFVDALPLAEVTDVVQIFTRDFADAIELVETVTRETGKYILEALPLVEVVARAVERTITETVTLVEDITHELGKIFTDTISLAEEVAAKITGRTITETITLVETIRTYVGTLFLTGTITLVETVATLRQRFKEIAETLTLAEVLARVVAYGRIFTETITLDQRIRGLLNGVNMLYHSKYVAKAGSYAAKYSAKVGNYFNKYLDPK